VKNILVFAPLFFAHEFLNTQWIIQSIIVFIGVSALASGVYIINDIVDRNEDKLHPVKKHRPLASGKVTLSEATFLLILMLAVSALLAYSFPAKVIFILLAYLLVNIFYSTKLKHVVIVDIFLVASMYMMRIYAGGELFDINLSAWLILCTFFLALFLISAKRRAEFFNHGGVQAQTRKVMKEYNEAFFDHLLTVATTASLVTYGLYVVSVDSPYLLYSLFFVAFGLMRYIYLVYKNNVGQSPEAVLFTDFWILGSVCGWLIYNIFIFYLI
jgi:4-hydroxybenzoate polyprenyltransferase